MADANTTRLARGHFAQVELSVGSQGDVIAHTALRPDADTPGGRHVFSHALLNLAEESDEMMRDELAVQRQLAAEAEAMHGIVKHLPDEAKQRYASQAIYGLITGALAIVVLVFMAVAAAQGRSPMLVAGMAVAALTLGLAAQFILGMFDGVIYVVKRLFKRGD